MQLGPGAVPTASIGCPQGRAGRGPGRRGSKGSQAHCAVSTDRGRTSSAVPKNGSKSRATRYLGQGARGAETVRTPRRGVLVKWQPSA